MGFSLTIAYLDQETPLYHGLHCDDAHEGGHKYFKQQADYHPIQHERLCMPSTDEAQNLHTQHLDVIVVGSGAGGGVVAADLARSGLSVLVAEKGRYFHQDDMEPDNDQFAFSTMYEDGGISPNSAGTVNFLSGSTFGGGTAINYSVSLEPPDYVRKHWAQASGLSYFASQQFQQDLYKASDRIGVSLGNICHNRPNQKLIEGCQKLVHTAKLVSQNTFGKQHHCEKCYTGCVSGIKNSTTNTWLKDAALYGAKFLDRTRVDATLVRKCKAVGVACTIAHGGNNIQRKLKIFAGRTIVASGALHTPSLLNASGLKNPNIGQHLFSITAVCDHFENREGNLHGFKIECFSQGVGMFSAMLPMEGAAQHKKAILSYRNAVVTFAMARDKDSKCSVQYDPSRKIGVSVDLSKHDSDNLVEGIVEMDKLHVAVGARQIHVSQTSIDSFEFGPSEEPSVKNPRFLAWIKYVRSQGAPTPSSGHQMASCRMGDFPKASVTKLTGETWDADHLYVADSSLFPSALGVNPMLTIEAVAVHVSRHIAASFADHDYPKTTDKNLAQNKEFSINAMHVYKIGFFWLVITMLYV
ncbi:hypothetical protein [Parasitella parasitica]|uniref:Long-chain-alcohol oxidase n=1 Tax=Parasitella parasitica TaxID=35722 RepID=A0A0B7N8B2_9FUNG|nr:hypothetical protein [Parasitella parasitica]